MLISSSSNTPTMQETTIKKQTMFLWVGRCNVLLKNYRHSHLHPYQVAAISDNTQIIEFWLIYKQEVRQSSQIRIDVFQ